MVPLGFSLVLYSRLNNPISEKEYAQTSHFPFTILNVRWAELFPHAVLRAIIALVIQHLLERCRNLQNFLLKWRLMFSEWYKRFRFLQRFRSLVYSVALSFVFIDLDHCIAKFKVASPAGMNPFPILVWGKFLL